MKSAVVAGHICLDIIPDIDHPFELDPGRLYEVGAATLSTGGAVSNTGIALQILGVPTMLAGKIGRDDFGETVLKILRRYGERLPDSMIVEPQAVTSYTLVVNIPGKDRIFLHCPGANHAFGSADIDPATFGAAALFHFGYPPIMGRMYANHGRELIEIQRDVKAAGLTTCLDMTMPDPDGPSGRADWQSILRDVLPSVDIFLPSADELLYMIDRERFGDGDNLGGETVSGIGAKLLDMGVAVAGLKMGARGLYLRTAGPERLLAMGRARPADVTDWADRELWFPVFSVPDFVGAAGAGDSTIAGFLAAFLRDRPIEFCGRVANAAGGCNVQAPDALSGIRPWDDTLRLVEGGWQPAPLDVTGPGWHQDPATGVWRGPAEA